MGNYSNPPNTTTTPVNTPALPIPLSVLRRYSLYHHSSAGSTPTLPVPLNPRCYSDTPRPVFRPSLYCRSPNPPQLHVLQFVCYRACHHDTGHHFEHHHVSQTPSSTDCNYNDSDRPTRALRLELMAYIPLFHIRTMFFERSMNIVEERNSDQFMIGI